MPNRTDAVALVAGAVGLATATFAIQQQLVLPLIGVAGAFLVLARQPTAALATLLILAQEISPTSAFGVQWPTLSLGHQVYFTTVANVPIVEVAGISAAILGCAHAGRLRWSAALAVASMTGISVLALASAQGLSVLSALNGPVRPVVLVVCGLALASTTQDQPGGWQRVAVFAGFSLVAEALLGLFAVFTGRTPNTTSVFYDSALPAVAAAALIAIVLTQRRHTPVSLLMIAACLLIVGLSGRRSIWLASAMVLLLALLLRGRRLQVLARAVLVVAAVGTVVWLFDPSVLQSAGDRVQDAWATIAGTGADSSTEGHVEDLRYGWEWATTGPFWGYGYLHGPLPGLVVQETTLMYVHNEFLQVWLRFGILGLALSAGTTVLAVVVSARAVRSDDLVTLSGALLVWITPVACMTAPFLSTTGRWPLLFGLCLGAALEVRRGHRSLPVFRSSPKQTERPAFSNMV